MLSWCGGCWKCGCWGGWAGGGEALLNTAIKRVAFKTFNITAPLRKGKQMHFTLASKLGFRLRLECKIKHSAATALFKGWKIALGKMEYHLVYHQYHRIWDMCFIIQRSADWRFSFFFFLQLISVLYLSAPPGPPPSSSHPSHAEWLRHDATCSLELHQVWVAKLTTDVLFSFSPFWPCEWFTWLKSCDLQKQLSIIHTTIWGMSADTYS